MQHALAVLCVIAHICQFKIRVFNLEVNTICCRHSKQLIWLNITYVRSVGRLMFVLANEAPQNVRW